MKLYRFSYFMQETVFWKISQGKFSWKFSTKSPLLGDERITHPSYNFLVTLKRGCRIYDLLIMMRQPLYALFCAFALCH